MKIIKDPVHGYVEAEDFILPLLDSPVLQRLRYIRQLGFSYLVYPGANHTRFEHSLGTMFLADIAARRFGLEDDERMLVTAAGLLHDVGHGPFSHASEPLMEEYLHTSHDEIGPVIEGPVHDTLTGIGVDPQELGEIVRGRHRLSGIIHGDLDVDRMDYLLRDAYYTGAPYGTVDAQRLIRYLIRTDEGTAVDENGMNAAEALLIARTQMRPSVYYHHVSRIGESMFQLGVLEYLKGDTRKLEVMMTMDDATCLHELLVSGEVIARDVARRLYERRLYKRALYVGSDQVNTAVYEAGVPIARRRAIGREIAEAAGVPAHEVLIDIPPIPREMSLGVRVRNRNAIIRFEEISPRIRTLNATRKEQWRLGVYTLHEHRNKVAEAGCDLLHIKKPTRQGTLF